MNEHLARDNVIMYPARTPVRVKRSNDYQLKLFKARLTNPKTSKLDMEF